MVQLDFDKNKKLRFQELNALAYSSSIAVKTGCAVSEKTVPDMSVDVASGTVFFGTSEVSVSSTNVVISAADPTNDRFDLVVVNSSGTVSVVAGTAAVDPTAPTYDPDTFLVLATVLVGNGVTQINNADITDNRLLFTISGAGSGAGVGKFTESFTGQTSVTVTHSLDDSNPQVQVYDSSAEQITPNKIDITDSNNVLVEFNVATTGTIVVHGGLSTTEGGVATFLHTQSVASTSWTVTHNLNDSRPIVQVFDTSGNLIEPQGLSITNENSLSITFGSAQDGKARILAGKFAGGTGTGTFAPTTDDSFDLGTASLRWKRLRLSDSIFLGLLSSDPVSPSEGQLWYNTTDNQFKGYNGTSTVILG